MIEKDLENGGASPLDIFEGEEVWTEEGPCLCVRGRERIDLGKVNSDKASDLICSELRLLSGVGRERERRLREMGYTTLDKLLDYPPLLRQAGDVLNLIKERRRDDLLSLAYRFFPKSHPLVFLLCMLGGLEGLLFLDIETMGVSSRPIIVVGISRIHGEEICWEQYVARQITEERAVLLSFLSHVRKGHVLVTFNGSSFDIPYLRERLSFHRLVHGIENAHLDLFLFSRRWLRDRLGELSLKNIERHILGRRRGLDVPSHLVPALYKTYLRTDKVDALLAIIRHNRHDLAALFSLLLFFCTRLGLC